MSTLTVLVFTTKAHAKTLDRLTIFFCKVSVKPLMVDIISHSTITAMEENFFILVTFWVGFVNESFPGNVLRVELLVLDTLDLNDSLVWIEHSGHNATWNSHGA